MVGFLRKGKRLAASINPGWWRLANGVLPEAKSWSMGSRDGRYISNASPHGRCVRAKKQSKSNNTKSRRRERDGVAIMILSNKFMANIYKP